MSAVGRGRTARALGLAGLLALAPAVAACGGSSGNGKVAASVSVGTGGATVSLSTSALPTTSLPSVTGSNGVLQMGQKVTLAGTVTQVLIPGGYIFLMSSPGQSQPVAVGAFTGAQVSSGDSVTVTGTVTSVNLQQISQQFGSQLTPSAKRQLDKLNGQNIVNATSVTPGSAGASGSVTPSPSASS